MTPIQIITVEMGQKSVRIMIENTVPNLYRAYFSHKWSDKYDAFVYANL